MTKKIVNTDIEPSDSEMAELKFVVKGQLVRIGVGPLKDCVGTVVEGRDDGR